MMHRHGGDIYSCQGTYTYGPEGGEIHDFSANINFRGMPETVRLAAEQAVSRSVHYPDPECRTLRAALAAREHALFGVQISPEQILCGNGAAELMFAFAAALRPERALVAVPSFYEYEQALSAFGCTVRHFCLRESREFRLEEDFLDALEPDVDCVILGNPNNPTGRLIDGSLLEQILERCSAGGIRLVLDESFFDFLSAADRGRTFSGIQRIAAAPNLFVLKSFTKMYGMPGLRFGYGVSGDLHLLEEMRAVLQPWNVSLPAQAAAKQAALELDFAAESAAENRAERERMRLQMERAGYRVYPSDANFLLFRSPDLLLQNSDSLQKFCLERGFLIRDCSNFPGLARGFFRVCIRSEAENDALMRVLAEALETAGGPRRTEHDGGVVC